MARYDMANASRPTSFDQRAARAISFVALAIAAWTTVTTIACVIAASYDFPYSDEWDVWTSRMQQGYSLSWFFALHNDHRIVTTRIVFALDELLFHARIWFPQVVSLATEAGLALLLWRLARGLRTGRRDDVILAAAIVCCLFSAQQSTNFIWGFQVQFFLVYAFAVGALWALLRASEAAGTRRRGLWMGGCLLLAAASSYSMANGVLIWPILVFAAIRLGLGRRPAAVLAAAGALVLMLYFRGWHTSVLDAPAPAWRVLMFALANAGSPAVPLARVVAGNSSAVGIAATIIGAWVVAFAIIAWLGLRTRDRQPVDSKMRSSVVLAHLAVFAAAASFAIASGRAHLTLPDAFRSRYITPPYILWTCLLILAWPRLRGWARIAVVAALAAGIAPYQLTKLRDAGAHRAGLRQAAVALAAGVSDHDLWPYLSRAAGDCAPAADWLRRQRLAFFHDGWTRWPGQPLESRFRIDAGAACRGKILQTRPVDDSTTPAWRISGQVEGHTDWVVVTDAGGTITSAAPVVSGLWMGYAGPATASVSAYAVQPDGKTVCFAGAQQLR